MYKLLLPTLLLAAVLAGCADTPKDVPIEERSVGLRTEAGQTAQAGAAAASAATGATMGTGAEAAASTATPSAETAPGSLPSSVETYPLPPGSEALQGAAVGGQGAGEAIAPSARNPLTDPDSLLSKRLIHFDFDSAVIREEYLSIIEAHAAYLKSQPSARVILQGHTDERGSREYNLALGQRRAESVQRSMVLLGVPEAQIEAVSFGEEKPIAEGQNEAAWAQNRRVEIHYHGE